MFWGESGMKNIVRFADNTVNKAVELRLPKSEIELICTVLQKYSVSCYDITLDAFRGYSGAFKFVPSPLMRCSVGASVKDVLSASSFKQISINWHHEKGNSLNSLSEAVSAAQNCDLFLCIENAQVLDNSEFEQYLKFVLKNGMKGLIYCSDGTEDFFELYDKISHLVKAAPFPIEFQSTNQLGIATAQALSALKAGALRVGVSVAGLSGYAPMEEVLMSVKHLWQYDISAGNKISQDFQKILSVMGLTLPSRKALIGSDVFAHESGIHVDGIIKNPLLYEFIKPEDVGLTRKLVIGKHSGTTSLKIKFLQRNIIISQEAADFLLPRVRGLAQMQKSQLSDKQLYDLYDTHILKGKKS